MAPTISVVMGNYNHAQYLPKALAPFLELERFFCEIIVADDASTDNSLEILEEYAARCPRMRIIKNPKNLGCIGNFTMLLREAKGDFVIGAAADDKMLPEHLETLLTAIQKYPDAALFAGRNLYYFEELRATFPTRKYTMKTGLHDAGDFRFVKGGLPIGPAGTFLRRDLFLKYYEQCSQMGPCADGVVSCMVIARHPFYFLNEPVAVVRVTSSNYSGKTSEKEFQDHFYPQFFDLLETEYPDLYAMMTECRGFQHFPPVSRFLLQHPRYWNRYTIPILLSRFYLFCYHFRHVVLPGFIPECFKKRFRQIRNKIAGKPEESAIE